MDKIIGILSNPLLWGIILFVAGVILKKKRAAYLKLLYLLILAVEVIDQDLKDIVSGKKEAQLCKIKKWVANRIGVKEGKVLDSLLKDKGLLKKTKVDG